MNRFTSAEYNILYKTPERAELWENKFKQMHGVYVSPRKQDNLTTDSKDKKLSQNIPNDVQLTPDTLNSNVQADVSNSDSNNKMTNIVPLTFENAKKISNETSSSENVKVSNVVAPHELLEEDNGSDSGGESDLDLETVLESKLLNDNVNIPILSLESSSKASSEVVNIVEKTENLDIGGSWGATNVPVGGKDWTSDKKVTAFNISDTSCDISNMSFRNLVPSVKASCQNTKKSDGTNMMGMELDLQVEDILRLPNYGKYVQKVAKVITMGKFASGLFRVSWFSVQCQ